MSFTILGYSISFEKSKNRYELFCFVREWYTRGIVTLSIKVIIMSDEIKEPQEASEEVESNPESPLEACQKELAEANSRFIYLSAEFENYKKRTIKEQAIWTEQAQDQALLDLVAVADDLERALSEVDNLPDDVASHFQGFALIVKGFTQLLKKYDIEAIPDAKEFDPTLFEAVMQQESQDHEAGQIVAVLQKGYLRKGRVLRPAKVSVAS